MKNSALEYKEAENRLANLEDWLAALDIHIGK